LTIAGARVDLILIGRIDETKGDARENFRRLRSLNDERAAQAAKTSTASDFGVLNLFECESEEGWVQLSTSILAAPHHAVIDAIFGTGLTRPVEGIQCNAIQYMNRLRQDRDLSLSEKSLVIS